MMVNERLNIPKKLKVGYQERFDTYSGKLAYVTYLDKKGKVAKHASWERWRSKEMDVDDFDNVPTRGFILNKSVGGKGGRYCRDKKCRIYDPRGFEIEISIENLLFILKEYDSSKEDGFDGEFVYAWSGTELILLPTSSEDYKLSMKTIEKKVKIMARKLKVGQAYRSKELQELYFLGKQEWYVWRMLNESHMSFTMQLVKLPTFIDINNNRFYGIKNMDRLDFAIDGVVIDENTVGKYVEDYKNTDAYKTKYMTGLSLEYNLTEWKKYLENKDAVYTWGLDLYFKRPQDSEITILRGRKQHYYEGKLLVDWLNSQSDVTGRYQELKEEFDSNSECKIDYEKVGSISYENKVLVKKYYNGGRYPLSKKDEKYLSDGRNVNKVIDTSTGEVINMWRNLGCSLTYTMIDNIS